jgi:hypothetical protein
MTDPVDNSSSITQDSTSSDIVSLAKVLATTPELIQFYNEKNQEKYGEKYEQSVLREDDTSETYRNRLEQLYPEPEQVAYIDAIFDIDRVIEFQLSAYNSYSRGNPPTGEVGNMFPLALNQKLLNIDTDKIHKEKIALSPQSTNALLASCNLAIWAIEKTEAQHIQPLKNSLLGHVKGIEKIDKNPQKGLLALYTHTLAKKGINARTHENILRGEINNIVDPLDADLLTSFSISSFKKIKEMVTQPLDFFEIYVEDVRARLALDDCGIGIKDSSDIAKSIRRDLAKSQNISL